MASKNYPISSLSIEGYKSIKSLKDFPLRSLNVLIGANGVGKSNFVTFFGMVSELAEQRLQVWVQKQGGAERVLSFGLKETPELSASISFGLNRYSFVLKPTTLPTEEQQIRLLWKQKDSDYAFWPSQLSDGSLRFICLVTALMQPNPPATIIIDEPELGLHPYAIVLLASLIRAAASRMQVIVSTQSVPLLNEFTIDDLIVVEREEGASVFKRYDAADFSSWLENYSIGELWEKNLLGGRPRR